ncbi:hypothetical protein Patl1_20770 [Pistacia atlantica]|uniref:Uncharacterized protein n=1 Tax=Pistacia atlantica TaxID=434234 RepID=A0ACC1BN40_9ROSI|nr:hypothetical protein Patl1_20770 [Pistacia atlantica]
MFDKIDLSLSSYDTASVAMVPSPDSPQAPYALSCTLACVLALKRWGIGEEQMNKDLNLYFPLRTTKIDAMLHTRHSEFRRSYLEGRKEYLAYVSEGMGKLQDWEMVMKYQRKNGSLFSSPSTTAAALSHLQDAGCLHYLCSVLEKFGDAVPIVYPFDLYACLFMVESLESLGIGQHFKKEIRSVLDETYQ